MRFPRERLDLRWRSSMVTPKKCPLPANTETLLTPIFRKFIITLPGYHSAPMRSRLLMVMTVSQFLSSRKMPGTPVVPEVVQTMYLPR